MSSQLAIVTSSGSVTTPLPAKGRLIIGSSEARANLVLNSQGVADVHSVIARTKDGGWAIQDMGSEFGTMLNGKRVEVARLKAGQTILLASVSLKVIETQPAQDAPATSPKSTAEAPPKDPPIEAPPKGGKSLVLDIPGYSIQETLGKGGMGAVFRARQDRLHRDVALKVLSPRLAADSDFVRRFHKEAQAVAALNHPNIVTVYDVGEASGTHFIAMEYMDDSSLEELLAKEGRLPWKRVAKLLLGAANGLTYAESRQIVHRDIKPSNLMLNSDDQVKISDLGLAQRANDQSGDGRVFGTPHFMAPEQVRGEATDRRCDIYSLGATGYQLLTGYTPFEGVNSREILRAVLTEEFEPIASHVSDTPAALANLIERMIARSPEDRPQSAESVVDALQRIIAGTAPAEGVRVTTEGDNSTSKRLALLMGLAVGAAGIYYLKDLIAPTTPATIEPAVSAPEEPTVAATPAKSPDESTEEAQASDPESTTAPEDDTAQKLFETQAENEFLRVESSDLSLEDRNLKLEELAEKYNGTTAAAKALTQVQLNRTTIAKELEASKALIAKQESVIESMTLAAGLDDPAMTPAKALAAIYAVPGQEALAGDEVFSAARADLRDKVCMQALSASVNSLQEIKSDLTDPDKDLPKIKLQELVSRLQNLDPEISFNPKGFEDLRKLEAEARALLNDLDRQRGIANSNLSLADEQNIAAYCFDRSENGLISHLRSLNFEVASIRMRELQTAVRSQERAGHIEQLAADLEQAAASFSVLIDEFENWKRNTVSDPRPRRSSKEAIEITSEGLTLEGDEGDDLVPWSSFSTSPGSLDKLFFRRLNREWTETEKTGVALALNFSATVTVFDQSTNSFAAAKPLQDRELSAWLDAYDKAASWAPGNLSITSNRLATEKLFRSLSLANAGEWAAAEGSLRHAAEEHAGSLLVLLLSDGSPTQPEPTPDAPLAPDGE
jgi:serine/threonine-protein kinase